MLSITRLPGTLDKYHLDPYHFSKDKTNLTNVKYSIYWHKSTLAVPNIFFQILVTLEIWQPVSGLGAGLRWPPDKIVQAPSRVRERDVQLVS